MAPPAPPSVTILGAGPAGLAVGYHARRLQLGFVALESRDQVGGNCITLRQGDFAFDSGAHRFHDQDAAATEEIKQLVGSELHRVDAPSQIFSHGGFVDFPLSPLNLLRHLGPASFLRAAGEVAYQRLRPGRQVASFQDFALQTYGGTIANRYLLNYSEKLWGERCDHLSPRVSGKRMQGLNLRTFLLEALGRSRSKTEHLDGAFYYCRNGIGTIPDRLAQACGAGTIRTGCEVTRVRHEQGRVVAVELNHQQKLAVQEVVSTLPLDRLLQMLDPPPPADIAAAARRLRFRGVLLVALFCRRDRITRAATVYFPEPVFPFTRLYEPKQRSLAMAPPDRTSLVVEIPCQMQDAAWRTDDAAWIERVTAQLISIGWIRREDVAGARVHRMPYAYPILERDFESLTRPLFSYLEHLRNLQLSGRCGLFAYLHVHDLMRQGMAIATRCRERTAGP